MIRNEVINYDDGYFEISSYEQIENENFFE
jgi:hypothetical protein